MEEGADGATRQGTDMSTAKDTIDAIDRRDAVVDGDMKTVKKSIGSARAIDADRMTAEEHENIAKGIPIATATDRWTAGWKAGNEGSTNGSGTGDMRTMNATRNTAG